MRASTASISPEFVVAVAFVPPSPARTATRAAVDVENPAGTEVSAEGGAGTGFGDTWPVPSCPRSAEISGMGSR